MSERSPPRTQRRRRYSSSLRPRSPAPVPVPRGPTTRQHDLIELRLHRRVAVRDDQRLSSRQPYLLRFLCYLRPPTLGRRRSRDDRPLARLFQDLARPSGALRRPGKAPAPREGEQHRLTDLFRRRAVLQGDPRVDANPPSMPAAANAASMISSRGFGSIGPLSRVALRIRLKTRRPPRDGARAADRQTLGGSFRRHLVQPDSLVRAGGPLDLVGDAVDILLRVHEQERRLVVEPLVDSPRAASFAAPGRRSSAPAPTSCQVLAQPARLAAARRALRWLKSRSARRSWSCRPG